MDRGLPVFMVLLGLRQLHDVVGGVFEGDELASARQRDRIVEPPPDQALRFPKAATLTHAREGRGTSTRSRGHSGTLQTPANGNGQNTR